MILEFWTKTSGTWINVLTVVLGTIVGLLLNNRLPQSIQQILTQGIGLFTLWLGVHLAGRMATVQAGRVDGVIVGLVAITIGGVLGEWWQIEHRLTQLGNWLKTRVKRQGRFTEGFVAASLLFCVGPMALLGGLNNGLTGDNTLLTIKAAMDGVVAIAFTSSYGIGVGFSALVILVYQGGLSLAAGLLSSAIPNPATDPRVLLATGVGGLLILGIGLNLLEVARVRVGSLLPALFLAPLLFWLLTQIT
jgi:uncharacterized membrane protein YqgA involved in biofilm formation